MGLLIKNVADVTIDSNANASNKDIRSLMSEKGKSHDKIIAFNKIFYEIKKRIWLKKHQKNGLRQNIMVGFIYMMLQHQRTCHTVLEGILRYLLKMVLKDLMN